MPYCLLSPPGPTIYLATQSKPSHSHWLTFHKPSLALSFLFAPPQAQRSWRWRLFWISELLLEEITNKVRSRRRVTDNCHEEETKIVGIGPNGGAFQPLHKLIKLGLRRELACDESILAISVVHMNIIYRWNFPDESRWVPNSNLSSKFDGILLVEAAEYLAGDELSDCSLYPRVPFHVPFHPRVVADCGVVRSHFHGLLSHWW